MAPDYKDLAARYTARQEELRLQSEYVGLTPDERLHIAGQLSALRWVINLPTQEVTKQ